MKKGFKLTPPPTLTPPKKLPPKSPAYVVKTNTEIEIERLKYFLFDVIKSRSIITLKNKFMMSPSKC